MTFISRPQIFSLTLKLEIVVNNPSRLLSKMLDGFGLYDMSPHMHANRLKGIDTPTVLTTKSIASLLT